MPPELCWVNSVRRKPRAWYVLLLRSNLYLRCASDSPQGLLLLSLQALHEHFLGPLRSLLVVVQDRAKEIY